MKHLKALLHKIINNYEETDSFENNHLFKLTNRYLLLLLTVYFIHFLDAIYYFSYNPITFLNGIAALLMLFLLLLKKNKYVFNIKFNYYSLATYIFLLTEITVIDILTRQKLCMELYYFPIIASLPFFFNLRTEQRYFIIVISFTIGMRLSTSAYDFSFIPQKYFVTVNNELKLSQFVSSIIAIIVTVYFVYEKDQIVFLASEQKQKAEKDLEQLKWKYSDLTKNQFKINKLTIDNINEIYLLAETNSPFFIDRFDVLFPGFRRRLLEVDSELKWDEIKFCYFLKLNYDTKRISQILNISVKAVENRKYRIKKKLKLEKDDSIDDFIIRL